MTIARYCFVATLLLIGSWVTAQQPSGQLALSHNLREALLRSGFEDAIYTTGAPDLERVLTSSDFGRTPDTFVSGYYFEDELDGQGLGPLHISRFDRPSRRWVHAATITSDDRGSVMDVQIGRDYVLIEMHASPSAGNALIFSSELQVVASAYGFGLHMMPNGAIRFFGSMVHFAPTHQETLFVLDPRSQQTVEMFPGEHESAVAETYRRTIRAIYAQLTDTTRRDYESAGYGPADDFDRSITAVHERDDGARVGFIAAYSSDRLGNIVASLPGLHTAVLCERAAGGRWSCNENEFEQTSKDLGVPLSRDSSGRLRNQTFDEVVQAMLNR